MNRHRSPGMGGEFLDNQSDPARLKFGVLIGQLEERYQSLIWPGIVDAAEALDIDLYFFAGAPLQIEFQYMAERNKIYDLAGAENVDGIILFSGTLANKIDNEAYQRFCEKYQALPLVSIALEVPNVPSILTDCVPGIHASVKHLVETHNCRRIAYIRGPEKHKEAEQRYRAYKNALTNFGIPLNPALIAFGNFVYTSGQEAVRTLLDERKVSFDALIAANDRMAMGAKATLEERGFRIPTDIALVGFDDIEEANYINPPLTTVHQPLYEQGYRAVEILHARLSGETVPLITTLQAELILRESCGCLPSSIILASSCTTARESVELIQDFSSNRDQILSSLRSIEGFDTLTKREKLDSEWLENLVDALWGEITQTNSGKFMFTLRTVLEQLVDGEFEFKILQDLITVLRTKFLALVPLSPEFSELEDIFQQTRIFAGEFAERVEASRRFQTIQQTLLLGDIGQILLSTFDVQKLMDLIYASLPQMGIHSGYLAIYLDSENAPSQMSKLLLAYDGPDKLNLNQEKSLFPSKHLIPASIPVPDRRRTMAVLPLFFQQDHLGFVILEIGEQAGMIYEYLRRQISSALKGDLLLQERIQAEHELKAYQDQLEELVKERTVDLLKANEQLKLEIAERKQTEAELALLNEELEQRVMDRTAQLEATNKELEAFGYSVSHDLRAPLRSITGFANILHDDFASEIPDEAQEYLFRIIKNGQQMDQLIKDLLFFSRSGRRDLEKTETDCMALAREVFSTFREREPERNLELTLFELPICLADPILLRQVFANLFENALKFTRKRECAQIQVGHLMQKDKDVIFVRDNGVGFDMKYAGKLFGVFQRLHSASDYEGTGVGLATVQRIIHRHGGQIWAESELDMGSTFYFTLS